MLQKQHLKDNRNKHSCLAISLKQVSLEIPLNSELRLSSEMHHHLGQHQLLELHLNLVIHQHSEQLHLLVLINKTNGELKIKVVYLRILQRAFSQQVAVFLELKVINLLNLNNPNLVLRLDKLLPSLHYFNRSLNSQDYLGNLPNQHLPLVVYLDKLLSQRLQLVVYLDKQLNLPLVVYLVSKHNKHLRLVAFLDK